MRGGRHLAEEGFGLEEERGALVARRREADRLGGWEGGRGSEGSKVGMRGGVRRWGRRMLGGASEVG